MSGSESSSRAAGDTPLEPLSFTVHSLPEPHLEQRRRTAGGRLKMLLVLAVCAAPVIASYVLYYGVRPPVRTHQGELIDPPRDWPAAAALPLADPQGLAVDPAALQGQWLLVVAADGACDPGCERRLYLQRQLREMLGRDKDRLERVWLLTGSQPMRPALAEAMRQATVLGTDRAAAAAWLDAGAPAPRLDGSIYVVDPMGRLMMRFPVEGDPIGMKRDLERLLRASASWDRPGRGSL